MPGVYVFLRVYIYTSIDHFLLIYVAYHTIAATQTKKKIYKINKREPKNTKYKFIAIAIWNCMKVLQLLLLSLLAVLVHLNIVRLNHTMHIQHNTPPTVC